jgi:ankyrin repeat domain-containing protein 42
LANNGANLNAKDVRGATPAHMGAAHGNSFTLHSALRSGVDVNAIDKYGWTPVHSASFHGRLGCLQLLVRWGAGLDDTDNQGNTPAHLSAMEGQLACLKFLVGEGPNPTHILAARNDNGETPKMLSQQFYKEQVVEYISNIEWERDHPEESENLAFPAHVAAYTGDLPHLRMLVENGIVNINERDEKGSTPAHKAAGNGHLDILEWLIEMGANINITNNAGENPKDVARRFAQLAVIKLLGGDEDDLDESANGASGGEGESRRSRKGRKGKKGRRRSKSQGGTDEDDDDESDEERPYGARSDESDDGLGAPAAGNTEGDGIRSSKKQQKESKGRARKRVEELERMLEVAKGNYVQLGGKIAEDRRRLKEDRDSKR